MTLEEHYKRELNNFTYAFNICSDLLDKVKNENNDVIKTNLLLENREYIKIMLEQGEEVKRLYGLLLDRENLSNALNTRELK